DVGAERVDALPGGGQRREIRARPLDERRIAGADHHAGAGGDVGARDREPEAAGAAGDDGRPPLERAAHAAGAPTRRYSSDPQPANVAARKPPASRTSGRAMRAST